MTSTSTAPQTREQFGAPATPRRRHARRPLIDSRNPFGSVDRALKASLGADLTLIYGMAVPMMLVVAVIVAFCAAPTWWCVPTLMILVLCCLAFVIAKVMAILDDPENG